MLAVGSFERVGGLVETVAEASASVPTDGDGETNDDLQETFSKSDATAFATDNFGLAQIFLDGIAFTPTPIGEFIVAPFVNAKFGVQYFADGVLTGASGNVFADAAGEFVFQGDPGQPEDLILHIHFFIGANGGAIETGTANDYSGLQLGASGGGGLLGADLIDGLWYVTGSFPGGGTISYTASSVSEHVHFEVPFTDGSIILNSRVIPAQDGAIGGFTFDDGFVEASYGATVTAWAYVTGEGQDVQDGDFNADGVTNGVDFQLWQDDDPRADGDEDGDVDEDDYQMWLSNAAPKVSSVVIASTVPNSYGTNPAYDFTAVVGSEEQLRSVPVGGANKVSVRFTKDVDISSADLDLIGLNRVVTVPSVSSFTAPDASNDYTAT
jgi:hypothetical protein